MIWLLAALVLTGVMCLDVRVEGALHHAADTQARVCVCVGHIHRRWTYRLTRTADGHRLTVADAGGTKEIRPGGTHPPGQGRMAVLRCAWGAMRFLLRHVHVDALEGLLFLRMDNAAHAALLCAAVNGGLCCIPPGRRRGLRVLPEFFRPHSTVHVQCIIRVKLGILILTAGRVLLTWVGLHRPTESEESAYGTSHR